MQVGNHLIVDMIVDPSVFTRILQKRFFSHFDEIIQESLVENNMHIVNKMIHFFDGPDGAFTSLYLLSESHLSLHSWPEYNYIAVDIFTCGNCNTENIIKDIANYLEVTKITIKQINRNIPK